MSSIQSEWKQILIILNGIETEDVAIHAAGSSRSTGISHYSHPQTIPGFRQRN